MLFMRLLNIRTWNSFSHDSIIRKHLCVHQAQLVLLDSEATKVKEMKDFPLRMFYSLLPELGSTVDSKALSVNY